MDFDWENSTAATEDGIVAQEIEESFEDPFGIRLLPDWEEAREARYFALGRSLGGRLLFSLFWTDGKTYRVIFSRDMTDSERGFYERKNAEYSAA